MEKLNISSEQVNTLYSEAGSEMNYCDQVFTYDKEISVTQQYRDRINSVLTAMEVNFKAAEFQEKAWSAIMNSMDVLLTAPCGSGKSLVYEVAIGLVRQENPKQVLILCLPVNSVMEEKSKLPRVPTAYITMNGKVLVDSEESENDTDVEVKEEVMEAIVRGDFHILMGHAESWLSPTGREIIKRLRKAGMIGGVCIDELHKSLHWKMRPKMQQIPAVLKQKAPKAFFIYMTATLSEKDAKEARSMCCMSENTVSIRASPVLPSYFFLNVQRPSSMTGWRGVDTPGKEQPGLKQLIDLILSPWKEDLKTEGSSPKITMIFCKDIQHIGKIDLGLLRELKAYVDKFKTPWVTNFSDIGKIHSKEVTLRTDAKAWITSSRMQMGLDLDEIVFVILVRPPTEIEDILQSVGRGGRKRPDGKTRRVICITLFNMALGGCYIAVNLFL